MNVAFVNGQFPQLSQTFVLNQIEYALQRRDHVEVYCRLLEPGIEHAVIAKWDLYRRLIYAKPLDNRVLLRATLGAARFPRRYAQALRLRQAKAITWNEFLLAMQLERVPDLFIANFGPNGIVAAKVKKLFFPRAKLAVVFHGYDVSSYVRTHGWERYREIAPLVDLPVAVNSTWAEHLRTEAGMENAVVHHLGAPIDRIEPWHGHSGPRFSLLFVGRMIEKKGFDVLIRAVRILRDRGRDIVVHAIGAGPALEAHLKLIASYSLTDQIVAHGARPHDYVLKLMRECDCLAAPSFTASDGDAEGIPVTLMEGMACGIPVISTEHSGIPELITDGVTGLLVPERNAGQLARAIARLMDSPDLRRRLAENAGARVRRGFDAARQNQLLFDRFDALVHPSPVKTDSLPAVPLSPGK
jgi:colanic acid/amylovoran biosynthesis glycosyltransferase